jgi:hypothetical protein
MHVTNFVLKIGLLLHELLMSFWNIHQKLDTNSCFAKMRAISNLFSLFLYTLYCNYSNLFNDFYCIGSRCRTRDLTNLRRQRDDDGQNKLLQINGSKDNSSYIINRMNLIILKLKTWVLWLGRVLLNPVWSCTCCGVKCSRCIKTWNLWFGVVNRGQV